ncbi:hypothetical protein [Actinorugispora endophytica]|uniref:Uncharacterized protein n=1 Tax=Actinorugispora endophytica TaxID=1605990 RepID=A0A4R6V5S0_9ACTN|nr:hypothetical protein [Actinorugispora endophytica]TDQ53748.1 hypothetical protein EV190_103199 [Actinorugispora endophytica]
MATGTPLTPSEQDSILKEIGSSLARTSPSGWERISFHYRTLVDFASSQLEVALPGGISKRIVPPIEVSVKMDELRKGMYIPGKGTWFSARYVVTRPGNYGIDYDYENEPEFTTAPVAGSYELDLRYFPRDDEHIPDWLRRKLREAENGQR